MRSLSITYFSCKANSETSGAPLAPKVSGALIFFYIKRSGTGYGPTILTGISFGLGAGRCRRASAIAV